MSSRKKDWVITQEALDKLLVCLDDDRLLAGQEYEKIREKLIKFFKWRGCINPEEYADRTIDNVARRIGEGAELRAGNPYLFFHGTAVNILKQHWRESERGSEALKNMPLSDGFSLSPDKSMERKQEREEKERRLECLDSCMQKLPAENLELITKYHQAEEGTNKDNRKELAEKLKIPINALRIRAYRIRAVIEECVDDCSKRSSILK